MRVKLLRDIPVDPKLGLVKGLVVEVRKEGRGCWTTVNGEDVKLHGHEFEEFEEEVEPPPCGLCNGTGNVNYDCEKCGGDGWVHDPSDGGTMTCPECDGPEDCDTCEA